MMTWDMTIIIDSKIFQGSFHSAGGAYPFSWIWEGGEPSTFYLFGPLRVVSWRALLCILEWHIVNTKLYISFFLFWTTVTGVVDRVQIGVLLGFASLN